MTLEGFTKPPEVGAWFGETLPPSLVEAGLQPKAAVVAVNGRLCTSMKAYEFLRDSSPPPTMEVIVWQNAHYEKKTVKTKPPLLVDYQL